MGYHYKQKQINGKHIDEHRYIMEQHLGRKLLRNEYVHHKNGDKKDNRIENLEIMTPQEHNKEHKEKLPKTKICKVCGKEFEPPIKHRGRNTICSEECKRINNCKKILQLDKNGDFIREFDSIKEASLSVKGDRTSISKCLKHITKTACGYKWEYKENENVL